MWNGIDDSTGSADSRGRTGNSGKSARAEATGSRGLGRPIPSLPKALGIGEMSNVPSLLFDWPVSLLLVQSAYLDYVVVGRRTVVAGTSCACGAT